VITAAVVVTCVGCYLLKLAACRSRTDGSPRSAYALFAILLPITLLAGLTAVQVLASGESIHPTPGWPGSRPPSSASSSRHRFIVVVLVAAGVAAGLRA